MQEVQPTIVICSSASFYKHANEVKAELETHGLTVVVPKSARTMAETGDYDVTHNKTWYADENEYHKKTDYMRTHFDEVSKGDIVLVINDEKHGQANYIGPNVLMEMSLGWYQNKPIFVLNDLPEYSPFIEEIKGFGSMPLHGNLANLTQQINAQTPSSSP